MEKEGMWEELKGGMRAPKQYKSDEPIVKLGLHERVLPAQLDGEEVNVM